MNSEKVISYVPQIYEGCVETDELTRVEDEMLNMFENFSDSAGANQFILTSDIEGIEQREQTLGIVANPATEDIEFRRERLLNRYAMTPPFTLRFLEQKLNGIIGNGNWSASVDYANRVLYIEASALNQNWYEELEFTINYLKPCNLVFTNVPLISLGLSISEEVSYQTLMWNYRMSHWKLGEKSFADRDGGGIIKMADTASIKPQLLNDTAEFIETDVAAVLINDTIQITEFKLRQVTNNSVILEYEIHPAMTSLVTNIKLLKQDDSVLTESNVYVPVTQTVLNKHTLRVKEG